MIWILTFLYFSHHYDNSDIQKIFKDCDNPKLVKFLFDKHVYCKDGYLVDYGFIKWFECLSTHNQKVVTNYINQKTY